MQKLAADIAAKEAARPKIVEPRPRCIRQVHEIYFRTVKPGLMSFGQVPNYQGTLGECRLWAQEIGAEWNLPIVEAPGKNPDLQSRTFETPAIYIVTVEFDEFESRGGQRCVFRY